MAIFPLRDARKTMGKHWEDHIEDVLERWRDHLAEDEATRDALRGTARQLALQGQIDALRRCISELDELLK